MMLLSMSSIQKCIRLPEETLSVIGYHAMNLLNESPVISSLWVKQE
jgi:hypothetical protein